MNTGLFTSQRNRPKELERIRGGTGRKSMSFEELKDLLEKAGRDVKVADLDEMGEFVVQAVRERRYIIGRDLEDTVELLHRRAEAISAFICPPHRNPMHRPLELGGGRDVWWWCGVDKDCQTAVCGGGLYV